MDHGPKIFEAIETAVGRKSFEKYFIFSKAIKHESIAIQGTSAPNTESSISPLGRQSLSPRSSCPKKKRASRPNGQSRNSWTLRRAPDLIPVHLEEKFYQEHVAQVARILYQQFCQLDLWSNLAKSIGPGLPKKEIRS